jgi:hypothetical protein
LAAAAWPMAAPAMANSKPAPKVAMNLRKPFRTTTRLI